MSLRNGLRRFKSTFVANNILNYSKLSASKALYKKHGLKKSVVSPVSSKDFEGLESKAPWLDETDSATALESNDFFKTLTNEEQESVRTWSRDGYIVLKGFYSSDDIDSLNGEIDNLVETKQAYWRYERKIMQAVQSSPKMRTTAGSEKLENIISLLFGKKAELFQSINFLKGSEQKAHSDSVHMTTFPLGYLIGAWIALEDVQEDQGPVFYHPGSHKLPYVLNNDFDHGGNYFLLGKDAYYKYEDAIKEVVDNNKLERKTFTCEKGDLLLWHANLLHGGSPITKEDATRKSMVLHYFAQDVICYHEITQRPAIFKSKKD